MVLANYFLVAGFAFFAGALAAAFGATTALTATVVAADFNAVRCSRSAAISALILSLRSVSLAMLALIFAIALAVLETTGAFLVAGFAGAAGFTDFAGAVIFFGAGALDATTFFAVAMMVLSVLIIRFEPVAHCYQNLTKRPDVFQLGLFCRHHCAFFH